MSFVHNDLGYTSQQRLWTPSTINCYKRGCRCGVDCFNYHACKKYLENHLRPPIKAAVLECVKTFGAPKRYDKAM